METEISMGHPHIIEEGIDSEEFLDVFIHILGITFKGFPFSVESSGEILKGLVMIG